MGDAVAGHFHFWFVACLFLFIYLFWLPPVGAGLGGFQMAFQAPAGVSIALGTTQSPVLSQSWQGQKQQGRSHQLPGFVPKSRAACKFLRTDKHRRAM